MNLEAELTSVVREWDLAMVANDADAIGRYMAEDWIIIGADGTESDKATFLALVKSGVLTHDVMESEDLRIRICWILFHPETVCAFQASNVM